MSSKTTVAGRPGGRRVDYRDVLGLEVRNDVRF
jgi:hypothetical protein